jgi:ubiquinone/menaquinone biosynthesis C-methylase UbiE
MSSTSEQSEQYLFRPVDQKEADRARLTIQYQAFKQSIDLFSLEFTPKGNETVVDLGCGPGDWGLDVAFAYPDMSVVGLDIDPSYVEYAMVRARLAHQNNVSFEEHDITDPLPFHDARAQYVNLSLASSFLYKEQWSTLFAECLRILQPGGMLRIVEYMGIQSSSIAMHTLGYYHRLAMCHEGKRYIDSIPYLSPLLKAAGFLVSKLDVHAIDFSEGTDVHRSLADDHYVGAQLARPYVTKYTTASPEYLWGLAEEMQADMMRPGFYALLLLADITAQKPS